MKLQKLFLKAFGPFTDVTIDFSGNANLHLVYGPNEAGKSSALRAMGDLRYGIPMLSTDNFRHDYKLMAIAGLFQNAAGQSHALSRRKGNKDTLLLADPLTGDAIPGTQVSPEVLLALTAGVERKQFETMYGLNSAHLREGGQQLISGTGELGAALFEASTGTAGIKTLLANLQDKAKTFYASRSQSAVLNESARQLEAARQRHKLAVTKPDQWKTLKRAHEEAALHLTELRRQLHQLRQRATELTELRAVEPILRVLDSTEREWAEVQDHVQLPPDARDRRLRAMHVAEQACSAVTQAEQAIVQNQEELAQFAVEPMVLAHASAIDRLTSNAALLRRGRAQSLKLDSEIKATATHLCLQAQRLVAPEVFGGDLPAFYVRLPSLADQTAWLHAMDEWRNLCKDRESAQQQAEAARRKLERWTSEDLQEPSAELTRLLSRALTDAQGLGNIGSRLTNITAERDAEQRKLERVLTDLDLDTQDQLANSCWLSDADIDAQIQERSALEKRLATIEVEAKKTALDLSAQELRRQKLAATGEVVTADTLGRARRQRDLDWQAVRSALVDPAQDVASMTTETRLALVTGFDRSKVEADRQADLLREGAERAAEVAECTHRVAEMQVAQRRLSEEHNGLDTQLSVLDQAWQAKLTQLGLPRMSAARAREWMALRQTALDCHERMQTKSQEVSGLTAQQDMAVTRLSEVLVKLGQLSHKAGGLTVVPDATPPSLANLIDRATAVDKELTAARSALAHRATDVAEQSSLLTETQTHLSRLDAQMQVLRTSLDEACRQLHLSAGASPDVIKVKLQELQAWVNAYDTHVERSHQLAQFEATQAELVQDATALAVLLEEALPPNLDAWLDTVGHRLQASRDAQRRQAEIHRLQADLVRRKSNNEQQREKAEQDLGALVRQADVVSVDELDDAENRSAHRRHLAERLQQLREQLASSTAKSQVQLGALLADQDSPVLELEKKSCLEQIHALESQERVAIETEHRCQQDLARIDTSDEAAQAREEMEAAVARYRSGVRPWAQLKLAEALLAEALRRHREKAQGPVLALAGEYLKLMTAGRLTRLVVDTHGDLPLLLAQPAQGSAVQVAALSEGTADQLYLALRLAALEVQRTPDRIMPLVLDDVFMTSDDERAAHMFMALERFAMNHQVLLFTHHQHLTNIAARVVQPQSLGVHLLAPSFVLE